MELVEYGRGSLWHSTELKDKDTWSSIGGS